MYLALSLKLFLSAKDVSNLTLELKEYIQVFMNV